MFFTILIRQIFGRRTTRKNDLVEIRVQYTCEWHQDTAVIDALLYHRVAVTQLGRGTHFSGVILTLQSLFFCSRMFMCVFLWLGNQLGFSGTAAVYTADTRS